MKLGKVIGQVVSTIKHSDLGQAKLLLVDYLDATGKTRSLPGVAADIVGAGVGEWVLVVEGSGARKALLNSTTPIDMAIIGILDEVVVQGELLYDKKNAM